MNHRIAANILTPFPYLVAKFYPNKTYDPLYRLSTAATAGSTGYAAWGVSMVYDRYGNRTDQNQTTGNPPTNHIQITAPTNRITGDCYDANGNLLAASAPPCPAPTYTYDARILRV